MEFWEHVHWYLTGRCNLKCDFCFAQEIGCEDTSDEKLKNLATVLIENGAKKVTITGGEPTLVKGLPIVMQILKEAGIYTSLHTNGIGLTRAKLEQLKPWVDEIAIPIDSLVEGTQDSLRGKGVIGKVKKTIERIQHLEILLVYHTVLTNMNKEDIKDLYESFISKTDFKFWRVYYRRCNERLKISS